MEVSKKESGSRLFKAFLSRKMKPEILSKKRKSLLFAFVMNAQHGLDCKVKIHHFDRLITTM